MDVYDWNRDERDVTKSLADFLEAQIRGWKESWESGDDILAFVFSSHLVFLVGALHSRTSQFFTADQWSLVQNLQEGATARTAIEDRYQAFIAANTPAN